MRQTILNIDNKRAAKFFLKEESYTSLDLPPYFTFQKMLLDLSSKLGVKMLGAKEINAAKKCDGVNHILYGNKDGKYAWRKYEIINPLLYVSLVNVITEDNNWKTIQARFKKLQRNNSITCLSIPVLPDVQQSQKATQVSEWVDMVEKESVRLALDFEYMYQTDITDCYGSIYTHSLSWALHDKSVAKAKRKYADLFGNMIDCHLQAMSQGQTNGMPQGSVLMNFIAEILLAYADDALTGKIKDRISGENYHILRYRDDYRIFVREPAQGEIIMKALSEVLIELGLRLNTAKTRRSDEIIINSIKPDKLSVLDKPVPAQLSKQILRAELLLAYQLSRAYPNGGTVTTRLSKLYKLTTGEHCRSQEEELLSILINTAVDSPNSFPVIAAFISKIIGSAKEVEKKEQMDKIQRKINLLPNSGLLEIWIQRIALPNKLTYSSNEKLCNKVANPNIELYQNSWVVDNGLKSIISNSRYIDEKRLEAIDPVISNAEVQLFTERY